MTLFDVPALRAHGARYSAEIVPHLVAALGGRRRVLDPFAGTGMIHRIAALADCEDSVGVELEPEWAGWHPRTICADFLTVDLPLGHFDAACTSPVYGDRLADKDMRPSCAGTYAKWLGRLASEGSSCHLQWGPEYRNFHERAWAKLAGHLTDDARFVLNVSDHVRGFELVGVAAWHRATIEALGFALAQPPLEVATRRMRRGTNAELRAAREYVLVFDRRCQGSYGGWPPTS